MTARDVGAVILREANGSSGAWGAELCMWTMSQSSPTGAYTNVRRRSYSSSEGSPSASPFVARVRRLDSTTAQVSLR